MVGHYWEKQESKAIKIIKAEILRAEKCGQGNIAQKKKRHFEELKHKMELTKEKRNHIHQEEDKLAV